MSLKYKFCNHETNYQDKYLFDILPVTLSRAFISDMYLYKIFYNYCLISLISMKKVCLCPLYLI